ncbi:MAG: RDD family protein [Alphaproteobacteria bacterium]|nr:RDD family protein [Alphaproteobacteria bacterium]
MADSFSGISFRYAGFWLRLIAAAIDSGILLIVVWILGLIFDVDITTPVHEGADFYVFRLFQLVALFTIWLYYAVMESAVTQATIGKMIMGLYVTDLEGERVAFSRASIRYWMRYVSIVIFFLGFVIAAFTRQKQALHDKVANCLVLKR